MKYQVRFGGAFRRDLAALDPQVARRQVKFLTDRIDGTDDPRQFGQALRGMRHGDLWRHRIGDWRIIASIQDETLTVLALAAGHRREIYR